MPTLLVAHLQNRTSQRFSQVLQKSHQAKAPKTDNNDTNKHDRKEGRSANTRFASCGLTCLHSSSVFQLGFSAGLTVLCPEIPHERKAWER
jgi:hypothetical protein